MIAEENLSNKNNPQISISNADVIMLISKLMKQTVPHFKTYLVSDFYQKSKLNEDDFTQIYIEQAQILIRNCDYPFNINGQYRDISNLSKGFSDFYFYPNEEGASTASIFSVESKRLPSPEKSREKEYVIGNKNNGGIERYKTEKHGKGLYECGLVGYIEKENSAYWLKKINTWIVELSRDSEDWNPNEVLLEIESSVDFELLRSVAHRQNDDISLSHLWVKFN